VDLQGDSIYFRPNNLWSPGQPEKLSVKLNDPQRLPELEPVPKIDPVATHISIRCLFPHLRFLILPKKRYVLHYFII